MMRDDDEIMRDDNEIIAHDESASASDLRLVCVDCEPDSDSSPVYAGDEWGTGTGHLGRCDECGAELDLVLVD